MRAAALALSGAFLTSVMAGAAGAVEYQIDYGVGVQDAPALGDDTSRRRSEGPPLPSDGGTYLYTLKYGGGVVLTKAEYHFTYNNHYHYYDEIFGPDFGNTSPVNFDCVGLACFNMSKPGELSFTFTAPRNHGLENDCSDPWPGPPMSTRCFEAFTPVFSDFTFFFQLANGEPSDVIDGWLHCPDCYARLSIASVPEPAAWALMLLGFGLAGHQVRAGRYRAVPARRA